MQALRENQTLVVVGETGSGKTTQIPQMVLEVCCALRTISRPRCSFPPFPERDDDASAVLSRGCATSGGRLGWVGGRRRACSGDAAAKGGGHVCREASGGGDGNGAWRVGSIATTSAVRT